MIEGQNKSGSKNSGRRFQQACKILLADSTHKRQSEMDIVVANTPALRCAVHV
jgi:hypothetical protein